MGRKVNPLYVGYENINLEKGNIKHPASIGYYNNINRNKLKDEPIQLIGVDLETDYRTSELKLLGFYDGENYDYYTTNFMGALFYQVKKASKNNKSLAYWNKLDPFVIYKQFLLRVSKEEQQESLKRFGRISGEWDRKEKRFKDGSPPIIKIKFLNYEFGITNIIRSSIQFYYVSEHKKFMNKVWAFDIATLYKNGLAKEGLKFPYYSKVDKSAHLVDWKKFDSDQIYREDIVLKSNKLDSMVVRDLGHLVQKNFYKIFGYFPNTLISAGSLCRSGIVGAITNDLKLKYSDEKELSNKVYEELKSIPISSYYDDWTDKYGVDIIKELFCITNESYSGGYIETLQFGYSDKAYMSDIASAYPSAEVGLYDLRNCKITHGYGEPPIIKNSYCFVRGELDVPRNLNFSPMTIKHPFSTITNIRATGEYKCSYVLESRTLMKKYGVKFNNEFWVNIETEGKISPFAKAINSFLKSREKLLAVGDDAQQLAKDEANSGYGITYECTPIYKMVENEIIKTGYRGGEFYNPIYASIITAFTRNKITESCYSIEKNGGKVALIMTDSIFWTGKITDLPKEHYKDKKTLGYFEKPIQVNKFMCLGAGRYEYYLDNQKYKGKTRGISITDLMNTEGVIINKFNWKSLIYKAQAIKSPILNVNTRILVSPPLVLNYKKFCINDMGLVRVEKREIDILAGKSKRIINLNDNWLNEISSKLIDTRPLFLYRGFDGKNKIADFTLSTYRMLVKRKDVVTKKERTRLMRQVQNKRFNDKNKEERNKKYRENYSLMKKYGVSTKTAKKYARSKRNIVYQVINGEIQH